ncbi:MAG: DNA-processing protein DprA [Succiniclasticum sp.]|jgi:DNA processing protein
MNRFYWAALGVSKTFHGDAASLRRLEESFGSVREFYVASEDALRASRVLAPTLLEKFLQRRDLGQPAFLETQCRTKGIDVISIEDRRYPHLLKEIHDPPVALYLKGQLPATDQCVAIVGPRSADEYGLRSASLFARDLAEVGLTIVSGGARGIDTAAHEAALEAGGVTIAILGCGVDVPYPYANRRLYERISRSGALLSEYPPGTPPYQYHFPRRNRLISGLCRGVLLTEATRHSGSLITAACAMDQDRELFCVPGNIFSQKCQGTNDLIAQSKALLVQEPADILHELYPEWQGTTKSSLFPNSGNAPAVKCTKTEQKILNYLTRGPALPDEIAAALGRGPLDVHVYLLQLQLKELAGRDAGGRWYLRC